MLLHPARKYPAFQPVELPARQWPSRRQTRAPTWLSTDLRDGNQALATPMNAAQKLRFFHMLLACGFKQIEVAFPAASQTDFDFVRTLLADGHVPDDVTLQVITQSRPDLIARTFEALHGARRAIVHLYNATAPAWRRQVFATDRAGVRALAERGTRQIRELAAANPGTDWQFQYSPETFSATEPDFALEICDAVSEIWQPTPQRKMIINLPATVELSSPNHYADQIEWMHGRLARRDSIVLSVHPHNDRGTAVAAAELALLAGAERVEGCLFGNGERTGNVDLLTLALNLYTQGIAPELDFSDIDAVRALVEDSIGLPVHPRHPYAGELVYTAFSGSHQDAIRKGMALQHDAEPWQVPYLPLDPADVGRSYQALIRVNSQSGKGGISWLLEQHYGLQLPRALQQDFAGLVQAETDRAGQELAAEQLYRLFRQHYLSEHGPWRYVSHRQQQVQGQTRLEISLQHGAQPQQRQGCGNGPLDALLAAMAVPLQLLDYQQHALGSGSAARAICYLQLQDATGKHCFGVAEDDNLELAALRALLAGINAHSRQPPAQAA
ncbi:2-isopropylmalate synthase [Vogesella sp. GCM10023246]|uniref:2-isopropylmalate synthase n=1 Tax=Vogesella oryzagri TaxID=3160864 RepID=A0ABV1M086_9NEIS